MAEQFHQGPSSQHFDAGWEAFEVANAWRNNGLAQRLKRQLFDPYLDDYVRKQHCVIERPLTQGECTVAALALQEYSAPFFKLGRSFLKFVALGLAGVATGAHDGTKEQFIFVEFGAQREENLRFGLPSGLPKTHSEYPQVAPLEVFSHPVGVVVRTRLGLAQASVDLLYSKNAFDAARQNLDLAATEIEIWRSGSPFAALEHLTARSSLLAIILARIERQQREISPDAYVLAIEHLGFLGQDQIEIGVYVGRANREALLQSPLSMQLQLHEYRIDSERSDSGTIDINCSLNRHDEVKNFSDESLREASHLWLIKHKQVANKFGVARTAEAFSWEQRQAQQRAEIKQLEQLWETES